MSHSRLKVTIPTELFSRTKIAIDIYLKQVKTVAVRKALRREFVPQRCCSRKETIHVVFRVNTLNLEKMRMVFF